MATQRQKQFVSDLESAAKAAQMRGMQKVSASELYDMAGKTSSEGRLYVQRLGSKGEHELVRRVATVFESFGLMPEYVKTALNGRIALEAPYTDSEPLELAMELPVDPHEEREGETEIAHPSRIQLVSSSRAVQCKDAVYEIISILEPLSERHRSRVLGSASVYFGVGE